MSITPETIDVGLLISLEFASELTKRMGYDFSPERIKRIADEARVAIEAGLCASDAYGRAVDLELVMYGDPNSTVIPVGILSIK